MPFTYSYIVYKFYFDKDLQFVFGRTHNRFDSYEEALKHIDKLLPLGDETIVWDIYESDRSKTIYKKYCVRVYLEEIYIKS